MTTDMSRRSVAKGAAWAVPALSVAAGAPAVAASPVPVTVGSTVCNVFNGSGTVNAQTEKIYWSFTSSTGTIPAGTVITQQVCVDPSTNPDGLTDWYVPTHTYPGSATGPSDTSGSFYIDYTTTAGAPLLPNTRITGASCFNVNFHFNQDVPVASMGCLNGILWDSSTSNLWLRPASTITITSDSTVTGATTAGSGSLKYQVAKRYPTSVNSAGRYATTFISKGGLQTCYPSVSSSAMLTSDGADDVVCYPSATAASIPSASRCTWTNATSTTCAASTTGLCTPKYQGAVSGQTDIPSYC